MIRRGAVSSLAVLLAGCTVGPNYQRPTVDVPASFRNAAPDQPDQNAASLGNEKWWTVYQDETLQSLIRRAIAQNYDVQIAANRILQAQEQLGITRADQFPTLSAGPGYLSEKIAIFGFNVFQLQGLFSWNVDFWGQYRRATESARANLLGAEWNRRMVISTLVENVAMAYFQLRELDLELEIARNTLGSRQQSLQLTETLESGGAAGLLDVRQAEQLVETAAETIPDVERQISQQEDLLSILTGDNPREIPRGKALTEQTLPVNIPAGLPSELLARRPDIQQAEQTLVAANAQIGVARAQLFPSLPLTGVAGVESGPLLRLFAPGASEWDITAPLTQPIFNSGKLRANVRLKEDQQQQALLSYRQTIQSAFRQVSDALIAFRKYREFREHQELLTAAAEEASKLSDMRYRGGVASYLEVLTNETNYFAAELNLARARLNERLSVVQVYDALGGGWE
ncbi:MAG TPA: efflux transporter outer membrane subunit [Bryobacteraceae bacterium]|nr:efflux transporter outer membrane subunit [Bryobacteraceae bacterium]